MLKNILFQFNNLYNVTCVYCRVEDKLSLCIKATPSCIQKKKLKLHFSVRTRTTWPRFSVFTSASKISSHNSWKTTQLSKMICNNFPLTVLRFERSSLSPEFPGAVPSLNLLEALLVFREYLGFFYDFKP